ncbi:hypothetical protein GCM10007415_39120 [Parapedobacter pyrenivorans]|uniref:Uncharacterized protein n=1 Tax=Parapedobacter pyrenivorans TaxID=1305674 RepID=A0A917HZ41_9SPHI|nr:hypothetical protein [Parapedobacter pyrenivorans]GGG99515.1 hypothetical protein GCM10007415_39120 [Parapedobacter pyrenivorans]
MLHTGAGPDFPYLSALDEERKESKRQNLTTDRDGFEIGYSLVRIFPVCPSARLRFVAEGLPNTGRRIVEAVSNKSRTALEQCLVLK